VSQTVLNCGYVPLVDCAPLVIAKELGFAGEEGLTLNLMRQPRASGRRADAVPDASCNVDRAWRSARTGRRIDGPICEWHRLWRFE